MVSWLRPVAKAEYHGRGVWQRNPAQLMEAEKQTQFHPSLPFEDTP